MWVYKDWLRGKKKSLAVMVPFLMWVVCEQKSFHWAFPFLVYSLNFVLQLPGVFSFRKLKMNVEWAVNGCNVRCKKEGLYKSKWKDEIATVMILVTVCEFPWTENRFWVFFCFDGKPLTKFLCKKCTCVFFGAPNAHWIRRRNPWCLKKRRESSEK